MSRRAKKSKLPTSRSAGRGPTTTTEQLSAPGNASRLSDWLLAAVLVAAVFAAYHPTWHGQFIWDDDANVTKPELQTLHGLYRIWFDVGATQQYYPLLHTAFWIEHKLWGDSPLGYHLVNIALHALAALMVAVILRRLAIPGAYLAAAIFALHPVQVESVAWVTELKNTLSGVFYLGAALAYLRFDQTRRMSWYLAAIGVFVLALLSKTVTVTLPAALLVILWWQRGRLSWRRDVLPLVPFFVVAAAAGICTALVERYLVGAEGTAFELTIVERCLLAGRVIWFYLGKLVWPTELLFVYPRWRICGAVWWQYLFPAATFLALAVLWRLRRRWRGPLAAALFFVGTLFPVLGFFNVYLFMYSFVADHFQYLPSLGIITLASAGGALLLDRWGLWPRLAGYGLCLALLATLASLTWRQSRMYADVETLYRTTTVGNPGCWMAYNNLGTVMNDRGRFDEAIALYQKALKLKHDYAEPHYNLGLAFARQGRTEAAIDQYEQALKIRPDYPFVHVNLGIALAGRKRYDEAIAHYHEALRLSPDYDLARNNLGLALAECGQLDAAVAEYQKALELRPRNAEAHNNLGSALARQGQLGQAILQFQKSLEIKPDFAEVHFNLGHALAAHGRLDEAIAQYQKTLEIKPDLAVAHDDLGTALYKQRNFTQAAIHWRAAVRLQPHPAYLNQLAWLLATCPDASVRNGADAVELAQRAVDLSGGREPPLLDTLAAAYAETGRFPEALQTARNALDLASQRNNQTLMKSIKAKISLYETGAPFREMPQSSR